MDKVFKKGAPNPNPKKLVILKMLEEERRTNKSLNFLVRGMEIGDTPFTNAQAFFTKVDINLTTWRVGKCDMLKRPLVS